MSERNYMTPHGAEKLRIELRNLLEKERPKIVETVSWAASNGDRSENGDYIYGKRRLREIDRRIRYLTKRLDQVEIVDPSRQGGTEVRFGATVTVEFESGEEKIFSIVGVDESNPSQGYLSWKSPMALALLGRVTGDEVSVQLPGGGHQSVEITEVAYRALEMD